MGMCCTETSAAAFVVVRRCRIARLGRLAAPVRQPRCRMPGAPDKEFTIQGRGVFGARLLERKASLPMRTK